MLLDVSNEEIFPLGQLPQHFRFAGRKGKRLHRATAFRWAQRGVRGVRLESVRVGGSLYTSREAVARFVARLSGATDQTASAPSATATARRRALDQVDRRLDALGI